MGSLTILFLWLFGMMGSAGARVPVYDWEVKQEMMGSYKKQVVTINGQSPGPTIQAHQGESFRQSYQQVEAECRDPLAQHPIDSKSRERWKRGCRFKAHFARRSFHLCFHRPLQ